MWVKFATTGNCGRLRFDMLTLNILTDTMPLIEEKKIVMRQRCLKWCEMRFAVRSLLRQFRKGGVTCGVMER